MATDKIKIGKYLSYVLRHEPEKAGVTMDSHGWVLIDELIKSCIKNGYEINYEILVDIVETNDKKRYSISIDGDKIRANQGHSKNVDVELKSAIPSEFLFHGTAEKFLETILAEGLIPKSRLFVHLSETRETAVSVGQRHGIPVVLKINSGTMHRDGIEFFLSDNNVWLVKFVDRKYIDYKAQQSITPQIN